MLTIFESQRGEMLPGQVSRRAQPSLAERLYSDVHAHRRDVSALVAEANSAVTTAATPLAQQMIGHIADEEARQLDLLDRMAATLRDALEWSRSPSALPSGAGVERAETIESIKTLLRLERERARAARNLAKAYAGIDGGLERALMEGSVATSESNRRILEFLLRSLRTSQSGKRVRAERKRLLAQPKMGRLAQANQAPPSLSA